MYRLELMSLSEYLSQPHLPSLNSLLPRKANPYEPDVTASYETIIQETVFACGGIGVLVSHMIMDVNGLSSFLKSWAAATTATAASECKSTEDWLIGPSIFPQYEAFPEDATLFFSLCGPFFKTGKFGMRRFVLDASVIANLKSHAVASSVENPTRVEVVSALPFESITAILNGYFSFS